MAKKKISEIITEENLKKAALKGFAYERALNSAMNAPSSIPKTPRLRSMLYMLKQ